LVVRPDVNCERSAHPELPTTDHLARPSRNQNYLALQFAQRAKTLIVSRTDNTDDEEHSRLPPLFDLSREEQIVGDMRGRRGQTWLFIRVIRVIRGLVRYPD